MVGILVPAGCSAGYSILFRLCLPYPRLLFLFLLGVVKTDHNGMGWDSDNSMFVLPMAEWGLAAAGDRWKCVSLQGQDPFVRASPC